MRLWSIVVFVCSSLSVVSQNFTKGFEALKRNDFETAYYIFNKYQNSKKKVVANYGLALVLSNENNKNKNFKSAYSLALRTKSQLSTYKPVERYEFQRKYGLTPKTIDTLIDYIVRKEYEAVLPYPEYWGVFINSYASTNQANVLKEKRDSLFFYRTLNDLSPEMLDFYVGKFPDSRYKERAEKMRDSLIKILFDDAYKQFEYPSILEFKRRFPYYQNDSAKIFEAIAFAGYELKLHLGYSPSAIPFYSRFIQMAAPSELAFQTLLTMIKPLLDAENWKAAIDTIENYRKLFANNSKIDTLIKIIQSGKKNIKKYSISSNINTSAMEYAPVVTADDSTIYFCGRNRQDNIGLEDIFVSKLQKNGQWTQPEVVKSLSKPKSNEAPLSISPDGNTMLLFIDGNVYISSKKADGWGTPQEIKSINSKYWDADALISPDGNAIFFASDRPGGVGQYHPFQSLYHGDFVGNLDIYVIVKLNDTAWSAPINLGKNINTPYAERSPFLHYDMKTLYFASDGWTSIGKLDIFKSTRLNDTSWTEWSTPVNLGLTINSTDKETDYKISADGTKAYFTKRGDNSDIYVTELPRQARPQEVCIVKGFVYDKYSNKTIDAQIIWENLNENKTLGSLNSDPQTGKYLITLPLNKNYGVYVSKQGYYPTSQNFDLTNINKSIVYEHNFYLIPIDSIIQGVTSIELKNIFFDFNKFELKQSSFPELKRLLDFLNTNSTIKIEIAGHTDNIGTDQYNIDLSQKRAEAVRNYLINNNVSPDRLIAKGYGSQKPISTNQTEEGRQLNRRVEIKVLK